MFVVLLLRVLKWHSGRSVRLNLRPGETPKPTREPKVPGYGEAPAIEAAATKFLRFRCGELEGSGTDQTDNQTFS